jgi:hypothetical protein
MIHNRSFSLSLYWTPKPELPLLFDKTEQITIKAQIYALLDPRRDMVLRKSRGSIKISLPSGTCDLWNVIEINKITL